MTEQKQRIKKIKKYKTPQESLLIAQQESWKTLSHKMQVLFKPGHLQKVVKNSDVSLKIPTLLYSYTQGAVANSDQVSFTPAPTVAKKQLGWHDLFLCILNSCFDTIQ